MNSAKEILIILWLLVGAHIVVTWIVGIRRGKQARLDEEKKQPVKVESWPGVSIIVPAWKEKGTIEKCIQALGQVTYPATWEAIILAGGEDGTSEAAKGAAEGDERFRVMERGPEPKNAAIKRGIREAQHCILVLLDCDNMVEPGWLKALITPIAVGASVSVGNSRANRITWVTLEEEMWNIYTYRILKLSWIQGDRSIAIRREVLEQIGGLPEHTYAREDWDIWARLGDTGKKVVFAEGARLMTDRPATLAETWKHQVRWRRTHVNGLWEHRTILSKHPAELFRQAYGYLLAISLAILFLIAVISPVFFPQASIWFDNFLLAAIVWLGGRQGAVAGAVTAYTGEMKWLGRAWMPTFNLAITIPASIVALATSGRLEPQYKGARHTATKTNLTEPITHENDRI